tara:strand:- start:21971 stop:22246 length:276 start_codon:yes stop_codon:yes gene_type:complete
MEEVKDITLSRDEAIKLVALIGLMNQDNSNITVFRDIGDHLEERFLLNNDEICEEFPNFHCLSSSDVFTGVLTPLGVEFDNVEIVYHSEFD